MSAVQSRVASISVNCEPGKPYIVQAREGDTLLASLGDTVELQCESQGGKPPAEVEWWDDHGERLIATMKGNNIKHPSIKKLLHSDQFIEFATKMQDKKTWLTVSILKFRPQRQTTVHCTVYNDAFPSPKVSEPINIRFKDYVEPEVRQFMMGQALELECEVKPQHNQYQWIINGNIIQTETENTLKILQINESYDNTLVKCLAFNEKTTSFTLVNSFQLQFSNSGRDIMLPKAEPIKSLVPVKAIKNNEKKSSRSKQQVFTCIAEQEIVEKPKYIWVNGKLEKSSPAMRSENKT